MAPPNPPFSIDDACSVIYNNTLYSYSSEGHLQSLKLQPGAEWKQLAKGVPVNGASCVKSTPQDASASALWVIGGTATDSSYPGLQRFTFADKSWDNITLDPLVTKDRLYHSAVYLNVSDSILVYAGTQDGSERLSSQTFTIQASEPHTVLAHPSEAPPAISPVLKPWTDNQAMMIYGSRAMVFDPDRSPELRWFDSGATLANPILNTSIVKSLLVLGDDQSKSLYTFDMTVLPNQVNRTVLVGSDTIPVQNAEPVPKGPELDERMVLMERDLTLADWPEYNATLAPSTVRRSYSIADDGNGLVVFTGGNDQDPLCMFQAKSNTWLNATKALVVPGQKVLGPSSISTASGTGSSTVLPSATSTNDPNDSPSAAPAFPVKILAAVLGSIIGLAVIIIAILFLLRCRRKRGEHADAGHQRHANGFPSAEKEVMEYSGRGLSAKTSTRQYKSHQAQGSQGSFNSVAILMGRVGSQKRENGNDNASDSSSQFNKKFRAEISKPIPQSDPYQNFQQPVGSTRGPSNVDERGAPPARPRVSKSGRGGSARRSSGWDRYWSGGSAMNMLGFGSKRTTYEDSAGDTESYYSENRVPGHIPIQTTQSPAAVPPLKIGHPGLSQVASGSPTIASNHYPLTREMSGQIERHNSMNSLSSYEDDDRHDAFSSGIPASVHETSTWGPIDRQDWRGNAPRETRFPAPPSSRPGAQQSSDMSWLNLGGDTRV